MSVLDRQISRRQLLQAERCRPSRHAARPSGTGVRMLHSRADHRRHHPLIAPVVGRDECLLVILSAWLRRLPW